MTTTYAFASAGVTELSIEEIKSVSGGESPSFSVHGRAPVLDGGISARGIANGAAAVAAGAASVASRSRGRAKVVAETVAEGAALIAAAASFFDD